MKIIVKSIVALAALSFVNIAFAAYPEKPIKIIVPFAAGGSTDLLARAIADPLGKELGQPVVIENNGGQGGILGTMEVSAANPDGYVLGISTVSSHATNPAYQKNFGYDPIADFTHIGNIAVVPGIIAVNSKFPANNYKDFEDALGKKRVGYSYASSGQGGMQHLLMEYYKALTKNSITHIPYRGAGPALKDTADGKIDIVFDNFPSAYKYIQEGKIKPIAVAAPERLKSIPEVPTLKELKLDKVNKMAFYAISGPSDMPQETVNKINTALKNVLAKQEVKENLEKLGAFPDYKTPEQTNKLIADEFSSYAEIIKTQNLMSQ